MLIVCRLCLTASNDVIHIFREDGIRRKVSSILSKHFGSLFEVTEEHDEAICSSCWAHTDSFHAFYQSIKSAQNCYSSEDEEDGNSQPDMLQPQHQQPQHLQHQQQNVKIIMYDSSTNEVIEQRHEDSNEQHGLQQQQQHQHHSQQREHQQHEHHQQYHPHVIVDSGDNSVSAGYDTFEVCEQTNDSSDLDLLMMIQPNEGAATAATDDNGHHIVNVNEHGIVLDDDEMDDPDGEQTQLLQQHHQQQTHSSLDNDPIMGGSEHRSASGSGVMSDFLHNHEHITVIEVSSPSQAQKLLQQQQQQQMQLHQQQQQLQSTRYPPTPPTIQHVSRIVQRTPIGVISSSTSNSTPSSIPPPASSLQANSTLGPGVQIVRKRKLSTANTTTAPATIAAAAGPSLTNVGTIVQRAVAIASTRTVVNIPAKRHQYIELSEPESPPDDRSCGTMQSPTFGQAGGGGGGGGASGEPYRMQCDVCSKTFKTFHRVQSHYRQKHNMNGYVVCCGDKFFEKDLLVDHILMHVNNRRQMKKISCEHCEQFFYRKRFYTRHLLKLHGIGAAGALSEPTSPVSAAAATTSATPCSSAANSFAAPANTSTASSTNSSIISHGSHNNAMDTSMLSPSPQRQTQIIRRVTAPSASNIISSTAAQLTTTPSSATKMPMIVSIQSIPPKRIRMVPSTAAGSAGQSAPLAAIIQSMTASTTASVSNNGSGAGTAGPNVKYESIDGTDEVLILGN